MYFHLKIFIAIIISLSITFADKIEIFRNDYVFAFMSVLFIYNILFMKDEDPGILILYIALYMIVWSIRLINKRNNKTLIKEELKKDL